MKRQKRDTMADRLTEAYEELVIALGCEFCLEGPLECECEDVELGEELDLDACLEATGRSFEAVTKLGREQTEQLLGELSLDANDEASWKTIESMTMWL